MVNESDDYDYTQQQQQQQFMRSLFATNNSDDDDDENDLIAEKTWLCPEDTNNTSITYHLAFLAPGHGNSVWNSSECIAQHLLLPEYRSMLFRRGGENTTGNSNDVQHDNTHSMKWPPSRCIEFGAGAALPSLALLKDGADKIIITDQFVNQETFDAVHMSVDKNAKIWGGDGLHEEDVKDRVQIISHTWGKDMDKLTQQYNTNNDDSKSSKDGCTTTNKADLVIASDCIYNPKYHRALLTSATHAMDSSSRFIVGYSLHGNVPQSQILNFFKLAQEEFGLDISNEFVKEYDGQGGIGSTDVDRGMVYVKVLHLGKKR